MDEQTTGRVDYLRLLRRIVLNRWRIVAVSFFAVAVPVVAWAVLSAEPTYEATATLYMMSERQGQPAFMRDFISPEANALYLAVLKSRSLAQAVIEALPKESRDELTQRVIFRDHLLALTNYVARLRGLSVTVYSPTEIAIRELQGARTAFNVGKDGTVAISATAFSPRIAVDLANTYVDVLLARTSSFAREQNRGTRELLENLLAQARATQAETEQALGKFQAQGPGSVKLPDEARFDITRLAQLETTLADVQVNREIAQKRLAYLKGPEREAARPSPPPPALDFAAEAARDRLNKLEAKLSIITNRLADVAGSTKYVESHPLVQAARAEVQEAQERLRSFIQPHQTPRPGGALAKPFEIPQLSKQMADLEVEIVSLTAKEQSLQQRIAQLKKSLATLSGKEQEYSALVRSVETHRNLAGMLTEKLTAARIGEQSQIRGIQVVDLANLPSQPSPKGPLKLILLGVLGGVGLGFGLATLREYAHQVVESEEEAADASGFQILGSIPAVPTTGSRRHDGPIDFLGENPTLLLPADACRMIRLALESQGLDHPLKTILVTSPGVHDGKTTVVLNLGRAFFETNRRILLIDADLRRPSLHSRLNIPNEIGLADLLHGGDLATEAVHGVVPGMELLPSGVTSANPSALLNSTAARRVIDLARERADVILIDSPPLLAVSDTLPLTGLVDGVVLVVRSGVTERRMLLRAKEQLERVGARVVGVVVNGLSPRDTRRYYAAYDVYAKSGQQKRRRNRR